MGRQIGVTIPLHLEASITFLVDDASEVTPEFIAAKLNEASRIKDNQGEDESGIYYTIGETFGEPMIYDPNEEG